MNKEKQLQEIKEFFEDRILGWMISDLEKSIDAGTNFLTALGCLVYTEVIGIFLPPLKIIKEAGKNEEKCFYRCLFRLKSCQHLINLEKLFKKETNKGIYHHFRHNMSHLYIPAVTKRKKSERFFIQTIIARNGIVKDQTGKTFESPPIGIDDRGQIFLATRNYTRELKEAYHRFYKYIFVDKDCEWILSAQKGFDTITKGRG